MQALEETDPHQIGEFVLLGRLGTGGMGRVFQGRSPGGRLVAVKVVHDSLAHDPQFRRRFAQEVAAMRRVGGFWTATVVDADPHAPVPWLATEYVAGPSLEQAVRDHGPLTVTDAHGLAAGLAEALTAIHVTGLVHRDLKPSNILLTADGPRVIDFGIARALDDTALTGTGYVVGSAGFLPPELAMGGAVSPAGDIFCFGLILVYATTGTHAYGTGLPLEVLYRVVHEAPDLSGVPGSLRPLLLRCLAKDPAGRPTARELLAELNTPERPATSRHSRLPPPLTRLVQHQVPAADAATAPLRPAGRPAPQAGPGTGAGPLPPETLQEPLRGWRRLRGRTTETGFPQRPQAHADRADAGTPRWRFPTNFVVPELATAEGTVYARTRDAIIAIWA
ncbi:protein kinase [Kitasatospora sp. NPDC097643]|uniref:protein kinase domain-containing protein n=1 Tax=Kitasatospora sp. NPDC097643 TaxID=3157230 RepID=UPI00332E6C4F